MTCNTVSLSMISPLTHWSEWKQTQDLHYIWTIVFIWTAGGETADNNILADVSVKLNSRNPEKNSWDCTWWSTGTSGSPQEQQRQNSAGTMWLERSVTNSSTQWNELTALVHPCGCSQLKRWQMSLPFAYFSIYLNLSLICQSVTKLISQGITDFQMWP